MSISNRQVIQNAAITTDTVSYGLLNPEQARKLSSRHLKQPRSVRLSVTKLGPQRLVRSIRLVLLPVCSVQRWRTPMTVTEQIRILPASSMRQPLSAFRGKSQRKPCVKILRGRDLKALSPIL